MKMILIIMIAISFIACDKKADNKKADNKKAENVVTKSIAKKVKVLEDAKKNVKKLENSIDASKKQVDALNNKLSGKIIDKEFYKIIFDFSDAEAKKDMSIKIRVTPKKDHHINDGFPVSVAFNDGCFKFSKKKFKKADIKKIDAKELIFDLKGKCDVKGATTLEGVIKFGHCTDEICSTAQEGFKFNISVK